MKTIKEYKNLIILLIFVVMIVFVNSKLSNSSELELSLSIDSFAELSEDVVSCDFKLFSNFSFVDDGNLIKLDTDNQKESTNIIFSGLSTENPVMKGNVGEDPLIFLSENDNEINLASSNTFGDMFFYKIYKKEKVATWYKSYDMFGKPYALLSMGSCR